MNNLIGGQYLLISITLRYNGLTIDNKNVSFNTGAGVYVLMKKYIIKNRWEKIRAKRIKLRRPIILKGYNGGAP